MGGGLLEKYSECMREKHLVQVTRGCRGTFTYFRCIVRTPPED